MCITHAETSPNQCHRCTALLLIADIRRNSCCDLYIPFTQATNYAARQKGPEVCCQQPQQDACDIAAHGNQERFAAAILVREYPNDGRGNSLKSGEEGSKGAT
jgi:hypothetical protein